MRIIAKSAITEFCAKNKRKDAPVASEALWAWHNEVKAAVWKQPADVKTKYKSASIVSGNRVVFNICGNKYRLVARIKYKPSGIVWIRFIGTHSQYDKINAKEV